MAGHRFTLYIASLFLILPATSSPAGIVDGKVAEVGRQVLMLSDLASEVKIREVLKEETATVTVAKEASFDLKEVLEQAISRELVYQEARRLKLFDERIDILDEMLYFENRFATPDHFNAFLDGEGMSIDDLAERFRKEKAAREFIEKKITQMRLSFSALIREEAIRQYYDDHAGSFSDKKLGEAKEEIRGLLLDRKIDAAIEEWLSDLRRRGKVKRFRLPGSEPLP